MSYPSIISQPGGLSLTELSDAGSSSRNVQPITQALESLIPPDTSRSRRILEIGSYPYDHIVHFASHWPDVEWVGTVRDGIEESGEISLPYNLAPPRLLDISDAQHWENLRAMETPFEGVILINVIHCTPEGLPARIFAELSSNPSNPLLAPDGWIATCGPFLDDDRKYKSPGDEKFDAEHIRAKDPSLGLRSIQSISAMAQQYGFHEAERIGMPKGNTWVVWRPSPVP